MMIRTARSLGFGVFALAAFGTAAGIAAIGTDQGLLSGGYRALAFAEPVEPARAAARPGTRCDVVLPLQDSFGGADAGAVVVPLALSLPAEDSMDLDLPGSSGFSVACAAGPTVTAEAVPVAMRDARFAKADLAIN